MLNNFHIGFTSYLYVSSYNITHNYSKIIEILCKSGIMTVVTLKKVLYGMIKNVGRKYLSYKTYQITS